MVSAKRSIIVSMKANLKMTFTTVMVDTFTSMATIMLASGYLAKNKVRANWFRAMV